jgi:two-component sensor histidine kinase
LPTVNTETRYAEAAATGAVQYSRLYRGRASQRWMVSLSVPVMDESAVNHVLVIAIDSERHLGEALGTVPLPSGWVISILDEQLTIAARRPSGDLFVGKPAHPSVVSVLDPGMNGSGVATSVDRQPLHAFFHRLQYAPWVVLAGIPSSEIDGAVWDALSPVLMGGLGLIVVTLLIAWLVGQRFAGDLIQIAHAATAFRVRQEGGAQSRPTRIWERAELRATLDSAVAERLQHELRMTSLLADKDLLMQEVHHRVKNSLQLVRGILSLQARGVVHPEAKAALTAAASRILTVADVHQHLYQGVSTVEVNVGQYLTDLADDLSKSLLDHSPDRQLTVEAPCAIWPSEKIIALGLIVTELVTNAIKYGLGHVRVRLEIGDDQSARLTVDDEGPGFAPDYEIGQGGGLGSRLITSLVKAQEGLARVDRTVHHGRVIVGLAASWRKGEPGAA